MPCVRTKEMASFHHRLVTEATRCGGMFLVLDFVTNVPPARSRSLLVRFQSAIGVMYFADMGAKIGFAEVAFAVDAVAAGLWAVEVGVVVHFTHVFNIICRRCEDGWVPPYHR
jgi:hypothetical protein